MFYRLHFDYWTTALLLNIIWPGHRYFETMSCNCNCTCDGTWQVPTLSLPINSLTFNGGNDMHCAQSSVPTHRLACNYLWNSRAKRSLDPLENINHFANFEVWIIVSVIVALTILCMLFSILAFRYYRLWKKSEQKNNNDCEITHANTLN